MLCREGVSVLAVGRDPDRLRELSAHAEIATHAADLAQPGAVIGAFDACEAAWGTPDLVFANAGIYLTGPVEEHADDEVAALIDINVTGAIATVREAIRRLRGRGGDIVVTSSISGHQAIHWEPVYSASKHAIQAFVHGTRRQLVGSGIRLGSLAPGRVLNELWRQTSPEHADPELMERYVAAGEGLRSADVAEAALFMITRPPHATVRDLVLLPTNQDL